MQAQDRNPNLDIHQLSILINVFLANGLKVMIVES
jgi:hypothetical protein